MTPASYISMPDVALFMDIGMHSCTVREKSALSNILFDKRTIPECATRRVNIIRFIQKTSAAHARCKHNVLIAQVLRVGGFMEGKQDTIGSIFEILLNFELKGCRFNDIC